MLNCTYGNPVDASGAAISSSTSAFAFASSTCEEAVLSPLSTSTDIRIGASMDAGEILISFLLLVLILIQVGRMVVGAADRVKTSRKYLGNNSPYGKEIRDL